MRHYDEWQMRTATVRLSWTTGANMAVAEPVFTVTDRAGRVVAEMNFAEFKAEFVRALDEKNGGGDDR